MTKEILYDITLWNMPKTIMNTRKLKNAPREMVDNFVIGSIDNNWEHIKIVRKEITNDQQ